MNTTNTSNSSEGISKMNTNTSDSLKAFNGDFLAVYLSLSEENRARVGTLINALYHKDLGALQELAADTSLTEPMKEAFDNLVKDSALAWEVQA